MTFPVLYYCDRLSLSVVSMRPTAIMLKSICSSLKSKTCLFHVTRLCRIFALNFICSTFLGYFQIGPYCLYLLHLKPFNKIKIIFLQYLPSIFYISCNQKPTYIIFSHYSGPLKCFRFLNIFKSKRMQGFFVMKHCSFFN